MITKERQLEIVAMMPHDERARYSVRNLNEDFPGFSERVGIGIEVGDRRAAWLLNDEPLVIAELQNNVRQFLDG